MQAHLPASAGKWELPSAETQFLRMGGTAPAGVELAMVTPISSPAPGVADTAGAAAVVGVAAALGATAVDVNAAVLADDAAADVVRGTDALLGSRCEQRAFSRQSRL